MRPWGMSPRLISLRARARALGRLIRARAAMSSKVQASRSPKMRRNDLSCEAVRKRSMPPASSAAPAAVSVPNSAAVTTPAGPAASPVTMPTAVKVPKAKVHAPPMAVMMTPDAVRPPDERNRPLARAVGPG